MSELAGDTRPSPRHIHVLVWSSHGAHHWRVRQGTVKAEGEVPDREQAWACAISGMLGAIHLGQMCDHLEARREKGV